MKDFKAFLLRGNLVDMAVGIVIGIAFGAVITSFVAGFLTPLIAANFGNPTSRPSRSRSTRACSATAPS